MPLCAAFFSSFDTSVVLSNTKCLSSFLSWKHQSGAFMQHEGVFLKKFCAYGTFVNF